MFCVCHKSCFYHDKIQNGLHRENGDLVDIVCNEICMKLYATRGYQDVSVQSMHF